MKGYKNNVIVKRHSNNDLTIQTWRLSTKNGLETEKLQWFIQYAFSVVIDCSISYVIKASAKSQILLSLYQLTTLHLFLLIFNHIPTVDASCAGCQFLFLVKYKIFCNSSQEISIWDSTVSRFFFLWRLMMHILSPVAVRCPTLWPYTFYYNEFCSFAHFLNVINC